MKYETWTLSGYVNNAFDERGILERGVDLLPVATLYIQPRTMGMNVTKIF